MFRPSVPKDNTITQTRYPEFDFGMVTEINFNFNFKHNNVPGRLLNQTGNGKHTFGRYMPNVKMKLFTIGG